MRRQALVAEHEFAPRPLPRALVEENIAAPLGAVAQLLGFGIRRVLGQPHHQFLVIAPVATRELGGGEFLHQVARLRVEDPEERFVAEGRDFVAQAMHVVDGVAVGKVEVGLERPGGGFGEGAGPGGPKRAAVGWSVAGKVLGRWVLLR